MRILKLVSQIYTKGRRFGQQRTLLAGQLPVRYYASPAFAAQPRARRVAVSEARRPQSVANDLEGVLRMIDQRIVRSNRVTSALLNKAIESAKQQGHLNAIDGAYLLRSTGDLLKEYPPSKREALTKVVWDLIDPSQLDIAHYNTLLRVYLENGTQFDPQAFLVDLKERGISPNRVTYQRIIERFCDMGDMISATKVIEFMKSEQMPVSEKVFHALIKGHLLAGDEAAAFNVTEVMSTVGLTPSSETFTALACGLIQNGNKAKAFEVIEGQSLDDKQILRLAKAFAMKDDLESVQALLERMPLLDGYYYDIINAYIELLSCKKLAAARILFDKIPHDGTHNFVGTNFIEQMVQSGLPPSDVVEFCDQLKARGLNDSGIIYATKIALSLEDRETAIEYLKCLPSHGFYPLRTFFFAPIICKATKEEEVYDTIRIMNTMGAKITEDFLVEFALPRMKSGQLGVETVHRMRENGCPFRTSVNSLAKYFLMNHEVEKCLELLQSCKCELNNKLAGLAGSAARPDNIDRCIEVLPLVIQSQERTDVEGDIQRLTSDFLKNIRDEQLKAAVSDKVRRKVDLSVQLDGPTRVSVTNETLRRSTPQDTQMMVQTLENIRKSLEEKNLDTTDVITKLLLAYCRMREVDKVEEILKQIDVQQLNGQSLAHLVELYAFNEDIETAMKFYHQVKQINNFVIYDSTVLKLATLLVEANRLPEANEILAHRTSSDVGIQRSNIQRNLGYVARLIEAVALKYSPHEALKMVDEYISKLGPLTGSVFSPLMKVVLKDSQIDDAWTVFSDLARRFEVTPSKRQLALRLIEEKRDTELEQMKALCSKLYGTATTDIEFASIYVELGKLDEARAIIQSVPLNRLSRSIERGCWVLIQQKQLEVLETFTKLLAEAGYNRDHLCYILLRAYSVADEMDKVTDLWTKMQEDDVILSTRTLEYLSQVLRRGGQDVPFVLPQNTEATAPVIQDPFHEFYNLLRTSIEDAIEFREKAKSEGRPLNPSAESKLLEALTEKGELQKAFEILQEILQQNGTEETLPQKKAVRSLFVAMAQNGMIEEIDSLWFPLNEDSYWAGHFVNEVGEAYVAGGRLSHYLDKLEKMPFKYVGSRWVESAFEKEPNCADRVIELGKRLARENSDYSFLSRIWTQLFIGNEYAKADAILQEFPNVLENNRLIWKIVKNVRETSDEAKSERLLAVLKATPVKKDFATAVSAHVDLLLSNKRALEAQDLLKQLRSEGFDVSLCHVRTLETLKKELALLGKGVEL